MVELGNCKEIYQKVCCMHMCTELFFKEKTVTFVVAVVSKAWFPYNYPDYLYLIAIDWVTGFGIFILLAALQPKQKLKRAHVVKQSRAINPASYTSYRVILRFIQSYDFHHAEFWYIESESRLSKMALNSLLTLTNFRSNNWPVTLVKNGITIFL